MASPRKSVLSKPQPNRLSKRYPVALEDLAEEVEKPADAIASSPSSMPPSSAKKSSRMSRLSKFFFPPNPNAETKSKLQQDSVLRKQLPAEHQATDRELPPVPSVGDHPFPALPPKRLQKTNMADQAPNHRHPSPTRAQDPSDDSNRPAEKVVSPNSVSIQGNGVPPSIPTVQQPTHSRNESETGLISKRNRSSWLPGSRPRSRTRQVSQELETKRSAWIGQGSNTMDYSLTLLLNGEKVPELWTDDADTLVYLFPPSSSRGPSFRIHSSLLASSPILLRMLESDINSVAHNRTRSFGGRGNLAASDASRTYAKRPSDTPPVTPNTFPADHQWPRNERVAVSPDSLSTSTMSSNSIGGEAHLYFPTGIMSIGPNFEPEEIQRFVDARNLFAFLAQQPLVATRQRPRDFQVLLSLAELLKRLGFSNIDGSTFGEAAASSFDSYQRELGLSDVRESREKTLEALLLAEAMRSTPMYEEAFAHAVGKYESIKALQLPIFAEISQTTRSRLERSCLDLKQRQASVSIRLTTFEFPSLFAGIAASNSNEESKFIRFKQWKMNFLAMRKFVMSYYRDLHGQWPPKVNSKKNQFVEAGLNRLVLTMLYKDLCQLYSLLVDRTSITTRSYDEADQMDGNVDPTHRALRKLLSEYDRSSPPVQPPVPFDIPLVPSIATVNPGFSNLSSRDQIKAMGRKLKANETILLLTKSHNLDSDVKTKFIQMYKEFEHGQTDGKNSMDLADVRYGHWIFLYAVIQALPMLIVDAPGVEYTEGVEYFLCQPSVGTAPWLEDAAVTKKSWYGVQNGQMVSLPSHIVDHGIEAVYRRSYCWIMANKWIGSDSDGTSVRLPPREPEYDALSPLEPPPGMAGAEFGVRPQSRGRTRDESPRDFGNSFSNLNLATSSNAPMEQSKAERSATRSRNRRSLALGLDKLPIPREFDNWSPPQGGPSPGGRMSLAGPELQGTSYQHSSAGYPSSRATSSNSGTSSRTGSASGQGGQGPLLANAPSAPASGNPGTTSGTTFDDILGGMANQNVESVKGKKGGKRK